MSKFCFSFSDALRIPTNTLRITENVLSKCNMLKINLCCEIRDT